MAGTRLMREAPPGGQLKGETGLTSSFVNRIHRIQMVSIDTHMPEDPETGPFRYRTGYGKIQSHAIHGFLFPL